MKSLFFLCVVLASLYGDFFVISGDKKVVMTPLNTGVIDFATFATIAKIDRIDEGIHAMAQEVEYNKGHANFRLATIDMVQSNTTITSWIHKVAENTYTIEFDNYTTPDGVMLQLFYHNKWYAVVFGEPLVVLQKLFASKQLDPKKAYEKIQRARIAFGEDETLKELEQFWHDASAKVIDPHAKYKKQETVDFSKLKR